MKVSDFNYELPEELIARYPATTRSSSRLLTLEGSTGALSHGVFTDVLQKLSSGDLLVLNDTRVLPARLFGHKETGGRVEVMVERVISPREILAHIRASKSPKTGSNIVFDDENSMSVLGRQGELFQLQIQGQLSALQLLEQLGHMPLPPYIDRADEAADQQRYQTVYSKNPGAVAAPTAGLHFDETLLAQLPQKGVQIEFVTLHVGAGTFQPLRVDHVEDHTMHAEAIQVSENLCRRVKETKAVGGRVVAVGTTSVRCLEAAASQIGLAAGELIAPFQGDTNIFIYPGYQFKVVDALITNFHLPQSTLIMLISAFAGKEQVWNAYREAIKERYRFFSYGDAMFITGQHISSW